MQCGRKSQKIIERYVQLFLIYFQSLSVEENVFWTDTQSLEHILASLLGAATQPLVSRE